MNDSGPRKLNALTALRFVAAAMIVLVHTHGFFGLPADLGSGRIRFSMGVSFFFVLSGFILAYVYEKLDTWSDRGKFLRARLARLWPAHAFAFLLFVMLISLEPFDKLNGIKVLANLGMVHGWIPYKEYFWSFNSVSWSISTEFGFYLCFLFLIPSWKKTWHWKLALIGVMTFGLIYVLRRGFLAAMPSLQQGGLIYISPIGRLFEFTLGMATALVFRAYGQRLRLGRISATLLEAVAICMVLGFQYWSTGVEQQVSNNRWLGQSGATWLVNSGGCFSFAFLILIMAFESGWIARILACPVGVLLGEISYSVYLLHLTLSSWYYKNIAAFEGVPLYVQLVAYWAILLLSSYLVWSAIERPLRDLIGGRGRKKTRVVQLSWMDRFLSPGLSMVGLQMALLFCCLVPVYYCINRPWSLAGADEVRTFAEQSLPEARNVHFGDRFVLLGASLQQVNDGVVVKLAWQSQKDQDLSYWVVLQPKGPGRSQQPNGNHRQFGRPVTARAGDSWIEQVKLPRGTVQGTRELAVGLWRESDGCLQADHGPRDPETQFILLPLPQD